MSTATRHRSSPAPRYSTRELQAAAAALAAGRFSTAPTREHADIVQPAGASTAAHVGATREEEASAARVPDPLVRVAAANAGAGASTIALALADAADADGLRARVLDAAAPGWSGLLGATATELGATDGWRRGRRGAAVLIDRVDEEIQVPADVPAPRPLDGIDLTILDTGWSMRELAAASTQAWVAWTPACAEVLVTGPHPLALSQTETALTSLAEQVSTDQVLIVVVGTSCRSERDLNGAGPLLRTLRDQSAVLFAPALPTKSLPVLGPDPLPKQLTHAAQRLLERLTTITGSLTTNRV